MPKAFSITIVTHGLTREMIRATAAEVNVGLLSTVMRADGSARVTVDLAPERVRLDDFLRALKAAEEAA